MARPRDRGPSAERLARQAAMFVAMEKMLEVDPAGFNELPIRDRLGFAYWMSRRAQPAASAEAS